MHSVVAAFFFLLLNTVQSFPDTASLQFGQGILGAGAKTPIISDADDVIERGNRIGIDKGTGRRLDTLNSRPVSYFLIFLIFLHVTWPPLFFFMYFS